MELDVEDRAGRAATAPAAAGELSPAVERRQARAPERALLVESDDDYASVIVTLLQREGWRVEWQRDAAEVLSRLGTNGFGVVLVNTRLIELEPGASLLEQIRVATGAPVITLSNQDEREEMVAHALEAADYDLVKPFSPRRLRAAVRAVTRRGRVASSMSALPAEVRIGDIVMSLGRLEVAIGERRAELSPREFALLHLLLAHPGTVFTREELARLAWGWRSGADSRAVDNTIRRLRQKIEPDPKNPRYLLTVRGAGYQFNG